LTTHQRAPGSILLQRLWTAYAPGHGTTCMWLRKTKGREQYFGMRGDWPKRPSTTTLHPHKPQVRRAPTSMSCHQNARISHGAAPTRTGRIYHGARRGRCRGCASLRVGSASRRRYRRECRRTQCGGRHHDGLDRGGGVPLEVATPRPYRLWGPGPSHQAIFCWSPARHRAMMGVRVSPLPPPVVHVGSALALLHDACDGTQISVQCSRSELELHWLDNVNES
jgi:hypothetical protein